MSCNNPSLEKFLNSLSEFIPLLLAKLTQSLETFIAVSYTHLETFIECNCSPFFNLLNKLNS